jgi:hypothetical protein
MLYIEKRNKEKEELGSNEKICIIAKNKRSTKKIEKNWKTDNGKVKIKDRIEIIEGRRRWAKGRIDLKAKIFNMKIIVYIF